jgi:hypothetical protein
MRKQVLMLTTSGFILACGSIAASGQPMMQQPDHQQTQQQPTDHEGPGMMGQGGMMGRGMMGQFPPPLTSARSPACRRSAAGAGRVDEEVAHPHPSQTRMCRFPASGSSWKSLAHGGADDTIRDSPAKKDSR